MTFIAAYMFRAAFVGQRRLAARVLVACWVGATQAALAGVTLDSTRVIYPLDEREVTVQLENENDASSLIQVWVDDGNAAAVPSSASAPFVVAPPIFRVDGKRSRAIRIVYAGGALPQDRESVYWLNVLDVPQAAKEPAPNALGLAFRTRIKIFVRPKGLAGSAKEAPGKLRWALVDAADGKGQALRVENPTPYHVSFRSFEVQGGGTAFANNRGGMVGPSAVTVLAVPGLGGVGEGATVRFVAIDDDSAPMAGQAPLAPR